MAGSHASSGLSQTRRCTRFGVLISKAWCLGIGKLTCLGRASHRFECWWHCLELHLFEFCHLSKVNCLLAGHAVPDSVAGANDELCVFCNRPGLNIWICRHCHLLLGNGLLFVLPIADGSRNSYHTANSTICNVKASSLDSLLFCR